MKTPVKFMSIVPFNRYEYGHSPPSISTFDKHVKNNYHKKDFVCLTSCLFGFDSIDEICDFIKKSKLLSSYLDKRGPSILFIENKKFAFLLPYGRCFMPEGAVYKNKEFLIYRKDINNKDEDITPGRCKSQSDCTSIYKILDHCDEWSCLFSKTGVQELAFVFDWASNSNRSPWNTENDPGKDFANKMIGWWTNNRLEVLRLEREFKKAIKENKTFTYNGVDYISVGYLKKFFNLVKLDISFTDGLSLQEHMYEEYVYHKEIYDYKAFTEWSHDNCKGCLYGTPCSLRSGFLEVNRGGIPIDSICGRKKFKISFNGVEKYSKERFEGYESILHLFSKSYLRAAISLDDHGKFYTPIGILPEEKKLIVGESRIINDHVDLIGPRAYSITESVYNNAHSITFMGRLSERIRSYSWVIDRSFVYFMANLKDRDIPYLFKLDGMLKTVHYGQNETIASILYKAVIWGKDYFDSDEVESFIKTTVSYLREVETELNKWRKKNKKEAQ